MAYAKKFFVVLFVLLICGCSTLDKKGNALREGYRLGARENMASFARAFHGNDFPYFYWQSPIVQEVRIPAVIENGLFVPEHNELVVIEPGAWRKAFGYPIKSRKAGKLSDKKEEVETYELENVDLGFSDITVLPRSFACVKPGREDKDSH